MAPSQLAPDRPERAVGGELRLPKPPGVIRQFWSRHPRLTDGLIAGIYFAPAFTTTLVEGLTADPQPAWLFVLQLAAVVGISAALVLFRRSNPWLLLGIAWVICVAVGPFDELDLIPILLGLYAVAVYSSTRAAWVGLGVSAVVGTVSSHLSTWIQGTSTIEPFEADAWSSSVQIALAAFIATLIGITVGNRRRYTDALIARAHDLARERDQQTQLAAAAERARIAREMHDIVSHGLTVMITLAEGSAATAERDPVRAAQAMRNVSEAGREALGEMRRMLGVLNQATEDEAGRSPQPDVAGIPDLVDGFREAGLPVSLTTVGALVAGPALELAVFRVLQEGLTNVLRHAVAPRRVDVRIEHRERTVDITIDDDAEATASRMSGSGRGLAGLRERVALYGGTLEAGPRPGRGWRLHAVLRTEPIDAEEPT
jgi:signal transduction histidine kinase